MKRLLKFLFVGGMQLIASVAQAQSDYPTHPIKLVVPYGPGGTPDLHARMFADQLGKTLQQSIVVENKVGGSGIIGAQATLQAPKDGYTLLWAASSLFGVNPFVFKNLSYDLEQFQPVSNIAQVCFAFLSRPSLSVTSMKELAAYMKNNPEKLNFGNSGIGNQPHLIWERFLGITGARSTMIVYKSSPEVFVAMIGGFVDAYVAVINGTDIQNVQTGKVQALATTCQDGVAQLPNVPTMKELGYDDFVVYGTYQLYVAKGVALEIVKKLAQASESVKHDPSYVASLEKVIASPAAEKTPEEFARWLQADRAAWSAIATKAKVSVN